MIAHTTNATFCTVNEVTYFRDAFKGSLQQLTRRSRKECFTTWNSSSKQITIIFFWGGGVCSKVHPRTSLGEAPAHTAAVAVDTFRASARLRCRTREFVMVSKWDSGTHPRCRSDSLVPSTQSEEEENKISKPVQMKADVSSRTPCIRAVVFLRSVLCWCTKIISAFSSDSSSGCWATNARIHCICGKSVCGQRTQEGLALKTNSRTK